MSEKKQFKLTDDLLIEALKLEIENVECPPAAPAWRKINTTLQKKAKKRASLSIPWQRYALAAAACVIIIITSFAYMNDSWLRQISDDQVHLFEAADTPMMLEVDNDQEQFYGRGADMSQSAIDQLYNFASPDPAPPDWPPVLAGEFVLTDMLLLAEGSALFSAALYHGVEASFLIIIPLGEEIELTLFVQTLSSFLAIPLSSTTEENGLLHFDLNGNPGLAWKKGTDMQALLVIAGFIEDEIVRQITRDIGNSVDGKQQ